MSDVSEVPIWPVFVRPVLQVLSDGETRTRREVVRRSLDLSGLSDEARAETLESGGNRADGRVGWALTHLTKAGWVERPARAQYRITDAGRSWFADHPDGINDASTAHRIFKPFWEPVLEEARHRAATQINEQVSAVVDPIEQIEDGVSRIHAEVAADLLGRLHANEPAFFEQAVLDLLIAMGYGGAEGHATRTQLSNDGGIDGIVDQDALGLSRIYVQAKRYALDAAVGRPEIQAFVGALHGNQANQGVFITTARFSRGAQEYAGSVPTRVVLIDGARLASLMIRYGVGVQTKRTVNIVEVDEDFFE
ncbi:restriction endonuclease [Ruania albidiflava]|uniref:restriction endonuclease n=1 Tax=Ruania albidiflava TaxID=366586 RepID=UPI0003B36796|nr:restriction endonuclease [Ruania albidiflava]